MGAPRQAAGVPHPRIAQLEVVEHPHGHLGARFPAALGHELLPRHVEPQPARAAQLLAHLVRVRGWVWLGLGLAHDVEAQLELGRPLVALARVPGDAPG